MTKLYCAIGEIVSGFVRTEFLLSHIFSEIGVMENKDRLAYFADGKMERKLKKIRERLLKSDNPHKDDYVLLLDEYNELRNHRNHIVHSLVLTNMRDENDFTFHNYQAVNGKIQSKTVKYTTSDLEKIKDDLKEIHNRFYKLHFSKTGE